MKGARGTAAPVLLRVGAGAVPAWFGILHRRDDFLGFHFCSAVRRAALPGATSCCPVVLPTLALNSKACRAVPCCCRGPWGGTPLQGLHRGMLATMSWAERTPMDPGTDLPCLGWAAAPELLLGAAPLPTGTPVSLSSKVSTARSLHPSQTPSSCQPAPRGDGEGASPLPQDPHRGCRRLERHLGGLWWTQPWLGRAADAGGHVGGGGTWPAWLGAVAAAQGTVGFRGRFWGDARPPSSTGNWGTGVVWGPGPCQAAMPT